LAALIGLAAPAVAQTGGCGAAPSATIVVALPAHPFSAVSSADGCAIFVSLDGEGRGARGNIVLLHRDGERLSAVRAAPLRGQPGILALTHDGKFLIAADGKDIAFLDPQRLAGGEGDPVLGYIDEGGEGVVAVAVSPDDRTLFVSDEHSATVSVIDLDKVRTAGFGSEAVLGKIPVGGGPVGLAISRDGRFLYSTSEVAPSRAGWPIVCAREDGASTSPSNPEGALLVIDAARARSDPAHAVLARVPAGCSAVRVVLSPSDASAYVSARGSNEVVVFDTAKLLSDPDKARVAAIPTGNAPVGMALTMDGTQLIVTNSNRFGEDRGARETLAVIDTAKAAQGAGAVLGTIEVGAFPRELSMTSDRVLLVTNYFSNTLELVPANPLPLQR
jgi:YVTN family beta-propeller protein